MGITINDTHARVSSAQLWDIYGIDNELIAGAPVRGNVGRIRRRPWLGGLPQLCCRAA